MPEYLFDVKLFASIRVTADDEAAARKLIDDSLGDAESANLGSWPDGSPIVAEFSVDGEHDLVEIDGEDPDAEELADMLPGLSQDAYALAFPKTKVRIENALGTAIHRMILEGDGDEEREAKVIEKMLGPELPPNPFRGAVCHRCGQPEHVGPCGLD